MATFIASDLHLMDHPESFLFNFEKEQAFVRLCDFIGSNDQLILAGDIFDLTGMTPCQKGQLDFFQEVIPPSMWNQELIERSSKLRTTEELLNSIKNIFPDFFSCLKKLALNRQLLFIPGNHDCAFLQENGKKSFAKILDVPSNSIQWKISVLIGNELAVLHGNQFDPANKTDQGCQNPGFTFTSALYHGILPALKMLGVPAVFLSALPAVRPEEESVVGIQHYLSAEVSQKLLIGFARLLQKNGFFFGRTVIPAWFLNHSFPFLSDLILQKITPERVRSILPKEADMKFKARKDAEKMLAELIQQKPEFKNAVIVAGHTHQLDFTDKYVNLGTWVDHIDGLSPTHIQMAERNLPVFVLKDDKQAQLFNILSIKQVKSLWDCPVLWSKSI